MNEPKKHVPHSTIGRVSATAHDVIDDAANAAAPAIDWVSDRIDDADNKRKEAAKESSRYISKNPLKVIFVAAVAGFLIGRFIG
jgi:ElaB/YqjD/DUF883 family membrane-anchored ribosome-binding protein